MKVLGKNKKALLNYEIIEDYEAGIILRGWEVKSIKHGLFNLKDAFVVINSKQEVFIVGMHVARWITQSRHLKLDYKRERKLLLNKKEIRKINLLKKRTANTTIVPIKVYLKNNKIKVNIALVRGRKQYEKRAIIKERELKKDIKHSSKIW